MESFSTLMGHLMGDYIIQDDFMAAHKAEPGRRGLIACLAHCLMYTGSVTVFTAGWMPWWGMLIVFVNHFLMDRYRLAAWWMKNISSQKLFATNLAPWSIIMVDNIGHLFTLWLVAALAGKIS